MKGHAPIFRILMLLYLAGVAYLCFNNFQQLPDVSRSMFGFETDKVVHFLMFFPFPLLAIFCYKELPGKFVKCLFRIFDVAFIGAVLAAATEIIQTKLVYRCGDFRDFKADVIAIGISCGIAFIIEIIHLLRNA